MSNPAPKTEHLNRQAPKWNSQPTRALRVPEVFLTEIENYARKLDQGDSEPVVEPEQHQSQSTACFGIRPSISELGWAVLQRETGCYHPRVVDFGVIQTDSKQAIASRLAEIESDLSQLLREFQPQQVILEMPFINLEHGKTASKTLQCLGVVQSAVFRQCRFAPVLIYGATWKSHIDSAKASREDIAFSVRLLFDLDCLPEDASVDAIAIAYAGFCGLGSR